MASKGNQRPEMASFQKFAQDTRKGVAAYDQFGSASRRLASSKTAATGKDSGFDVFGKSNGIQHNQDDSGSDDSTSSSEDDSDSDSDSGGLEKIVQNSLKQRRSKDDVIADSDTERQTKQKSKSKATAAATSVSSSDSDSSSDSGDTDSESDSDSSAKVPAAAAATAAPTTKPIAKTTNGAPPKSAAVVVQETPSDEEDSDASSSSSQEEDSDVEMADESIAIVDRQPQQQQQPNPATITTKKAVATKANFQSSGFELRQATQTAADAQNLAEIFRDAEKQGKQVWYFTAPASVPINVVEKLEIPLEQARNGQSVFSHNGENFGMAFDGPAAKNTIQLLIPNTSGTKYKSTHQIDQVMHVKRITTVSGDAAKTLSVTAAPPRAQPNGLTTRYEAFGIPKSSSTLPTGLPRIQSAVPLPKIPSSSQQAPPQPPPSSSSLAPKSSNPDAMDVDPAEKKSKKKRSKDKAEASAPVVVATPDATRKRKITPEDDDDAPSQQLRAEKASASQRLKKTKRDASPEIGSDNHLSAVAASASKKMTPVPLPASFSRSIGPVASPVPAAAAPATADATSTKARSKSTKKATTTTKATKAAGTQDKENAGANPATATAAAATSSTASSRKETPILPPSFPITAVKSADALLSKGKKKSKKSLGETTA